MSSADGELTIMVHAFVNLNDNGEVDPNGQYPEHAWAPDCGEDGPNGWSVWVRKETPNDPIEPFTSVDEYDQDFETYDEADAYALGLQEKLPNAGIELY